MKLLRTLYLLLAIGFASVLLFGLINNVFSIGLVADAKSTSVDVIQQEKQDKWQTISGYVYMTDGTVLRYSYSLGINNGKDHRAYLFTQFDNQARFGSTDTIIAQIYIPELDIVVEKESECGGTASTALVNLNNCSSVVEYKGNIYYTGIIISATALVEIGGQQLRPLTLYNS